MLIDNVVSIASLDHVERDSDCSVEQVNSQPSAISPVSCDAEEYLDDVQAEAVILAARLRANSSMHT